MRDLFSRLNFRRAISPAAAVTDNTAFVSQILDRSGYEGVGVIVQAGAITDVDATITALEHGDASNLSDAAAVPDSQLIGTEVLAGLTFADDNAVRKLGYTGNKRYLRLTLTPLLNTSGNIFLSATWVLGYGRFAPEANPPV